jgi:hypothetical protein
MNYKKLICATFVALTCVAMPAFATDTKTNASASDMPACKGMKDCEDGKLCKAADNECKGGNQCSCHGAAGHAEHHSHESQAAAPSKHGN